MFGRLPGLVCTIGEYIYKIVYSVACKMCGEIHHIESLYKDHPGLSKAIKDIKIFQVF